MAAGFEYFTSDDPGAPVLSGQAGRLIQVLDWVLVSKGGWQKAFAGTNLAAYRSDAGNRFFLRVDDTQARYARLRGYRSMTAVSTGTTPFPNTTQANTSQWGIAKAFASGASARKYWGIRTNRFVLLFVEHVDYDTYSESWWGGNQVNLMVFGDIPSFCEADSHNTVLAGTPYAYEANSYFTLGSGFENGANLRPGGVIATPVFAGISGNPTGSMASPTSAIITPWPVQSDGEGANNAQAAVNLSGRLHFAPMLVVCGASSGYETGVYLRARIPNFHMVYGNGLNAETPGTPTYWNEEFAVGSREFRTVMMLQSNSNPRWATPYLLETSDTDGAL